MTRSRRNFDSRDVTLERRRALTIFGRARERAVRTLVSRDTLRGAE